MDPWKKEELSYWSAAVGTTPFTTLTATNTGQDPLPPPTAALLWSPEFGTDRLSRIVITFISLAQESNTTFLSREKLQKPIEVDLFLPDTPPPTCSVDSARMSENEREKPGKKKGDDIEKKRNALLQKLDMMIIKRGLKRNNQKKELVPGTMRGSNLQEAPPRCKLVLSFWCWSLLIAFLPRCHLVLVPSAVPLACILFFHLHLSQQSLLSWVVLHQSKGSLWGQNCSAASPSTHGEGLCPFLPLCFATLPQTICLISVVQWKHQKWWGESCVVNDGWCLFPSWLQQTGSIHLFWLSVPFSCILFCSFFLHLHSAYSSTAQMQDLVALPEELFARVSLQILVFQSNKLTSLPPDISKPLHATLSGLHSA